MKVNGQLPVNLSEVNAGKAREKGQNGPSTRTGQNRATETTQNQAATTAARIKDAIRNEPDVRPNRVAEVKERIRSGKYQVEPERLAENMMLASLKEDLEKS